ncbi:MAG: sigma-70 family RNA polymerase sigma factor [Candidatus Nitrohelix vancouverensis]|uniref:Sigma-70 family RNA polymerase sigma factor n=1 Tax=Candidatus Nitrohelix vancouverensis TaxID=2705534 RepID=A0A7T0C4X6_9BACT|nr:MAG: sigma-70 family RNA polymerase sigma factor [Candidatus Nitrohelix vancouverensis]
MASTFEAYYDELKAYLIQKIGCPSVAEDILHDTWLRAVGRSSQSPVEYPRAFLYKVAKNLLIDRKRREQLVSRHMVQGEVSEAIPDAQVSADSELIHRERLVLFQQAVDELPAKCRQVFVMRKFELMSQAEIAERLGISRNMVEKHLRKALRHCLQRMNDAK